MGLHLDQQHLPGDESTHFAEGFFCALDKDSVSASATVLDYHLGVAQISIN